MRRLMVFVLGAVLLVGAAPASATPHRHPATPCSRGLVALTFDDGPSATVTPRLVRLLERYDVPATFFMVGSRVVSAPETALLVQRHGFAIGNHTWIHTDLTTQTDAEIVHAMRSTHHALVEAGVQPTALARPPYGAINDRVRKVLTGLGLTPVLWTIDSRDWAGGTPQQILHTVVSETHPHATNIVLQHDGVTNSPATLRALPDEITTLRDRGYCFAPLDAAGRPTPPVPVASVSTDVRRATEGESVRVTVRLDQPTSRPTTIRVQGWAARTLRFPVGDTVAHFRARVPQDRIDEAGEQLSLQTGTSTATIRVIDDDPPPVVSAVGGTVTASPLIETTAPVVVRLDHVSGRDVHAQVRVGQTRTWVRVPAGERSASIAFPVPTEGPGRPSREVPVRILRTVHAERGGTTSVTVNPPDQTLVEAIRSALADVTWPVVRVPDLF